MGTPSGPGATATPARLPGATSWTPEPVILAPVHAVTQNPTADEVRTYLELTRLLDDLERTNPEVSAPLRLTLVRAHREHQVTWLDEARFRAVVAELTGHARRTASASIAG